MAFSMPSVTTLGVDLRVAGMAEGHQVCFIVVTAFSQRLDVMHQLRLGKPAFVVVRLFCSI